VKKLPSVILLIFTAQFCIAQDYISKSRNEIKILYLQKLIPAYSDTSYYYFNDTKEELKITKTGADKIEAIYCLNDYGWCGSIEIDYYNEKYISTHLKNIINGETNKWVKIDENYYITKNKFAVSSDSKNGTMYTCGTLKIVPSGIDAIPLKIICNTITLDRKSWKKLIKKK
jgi:hypothetical protein